MTVITASDLNTTSGQYTSTLSAQSANSNLLDLETISVDVKDYSSTSNAQYGQVDFTPTSDVRLWALYFRAVSPAATSKVLTLSLTAISDQQVSVPDYLLGFTVQLGLSFSAIGTATTSTPLNATSGSASGIFLVGGVTYRLAVTAGTANACDRVVGTLQLQVIPRRK